MVTYTAATLTCGDTNAYATITVHALPIHGAIISGTTEFCSGATITVTETMTGGTWSGSGVSVTGTGTSATVTGGSGGAAQVYYTITSPFGCGSAIDTLNLTIDPYPTLYPITGVVSLCTGTATSTLYEGATGGWWSVYDPSIVSVDSYGVVTPINAGVDTVYYSLSNACGTSVVRTAVTVNQTPIAGSISGPSNLCPGTTTTFTVGGSTGGGVWSFTNTSLATVGASTGTVIALSPGPDTLTYFVTSATCGSDSVSVIIAIDTLPVPGTITPGSTTVCVASTTVFADAAPGGVWSVTNPSLATINTVGVVSGLAVGVDTIVYTVTNSCATNFVTATLTVNPLPFAGTISGARSLCVSTGSSYTASVTGGVWSLTNGTGSITATGIVTGLTGITGPVNDTVLYSVTNSCGTAVASYEVTINPLPFAGTITGLHTHVCEGDSIILINPTGLQVGVWASSNTGAATVSLGYGDSVTVYGGSTPGTTVISYTFTNYCGTATDTISIIDRPTGHCEDGVAIQTAPTGEISIYPNPAVSVLHIDAPVKVNIAVMSADGKIITKQNDVTDIDVSNLANGLYMIMIYDQDNALLKTSKFIKAN